ncbi:hypothetical protein [Nostoc sp.]
MQLKTAINTEFEAMYIAILGERENFSLSGQRAFEPLNLSSGRDVG